MRHRIPGFDIARAYAIFGMFIVNFNFCFGSFQTKSFLGQFLNLFTGNSTAIFILCAGMGVSLMTNNVSNDAPNNKNKIKSIIVKRSWFLFALGLLLYNWWPGDILHFYGGYMHIAVFMAFVPKKYLLIGAVTAILLFHILLFIIPVFTSWDLATFRYADFWTIKGFLRNTFYNGWNAIFPWIAYFYLGMWLGRLNWQDKKVRKTIFLIGLALFVLFEGLRKYALYKQFNPTLLDYIMYDYFPPYLPFMMITASYGVMVITTCIWLADKFSDSKLLHWLAETGKMTLTHYVVHLTIGMLVFQLLTGIKYTGFLQTGMPGSPAFILAFSTLFFLISVAFSVLWRRKCKNGPLELLMRKFSG